MTVKEYLDNLNKMYTLVGGDLVDLTILPSATKMLREIKRRVVQDGANSYMQPLGNYSTKPFSVTKDKFVNKGAFAPTDTTKQTVSYKVKGKTRKRKVEKKTMYLRNGYKELREIQNLQAAFIDLKYSGKMIRSFQLAKGENAVLMGITTDRSAKVYRSLVNRFGQFYQPSENEKKIYMQQVSSLTARLVRGAFEGKTLTPTIEEQ